MFIIHIVTHSTPIANCGSWFICVNLFGKNTFLGCHFSRTQDNASRPVCLATSLRPLLRIIIKNGQRHSTIVVNLWKGVEKLLDTILSKFRESIRLPDNVNGIDERKFKKHKRLKYVSFPPTLKYVGREAFQGCVSLKSIELPEGGEEIEDSAFENCKRLCRVKLPSTLKEIGERVFKNCVSIKSIEIPEGVEELKEGVFAGCKNLRSIKLPSTLKKIDRKAFQGCRALEFIEIPAGVKEISVSAFEGCPFQPAPLVNPDSNSNVQPDLTIKPVPNSNVQPDLTIKSAPELSIKSTSPLRLRFLFLLILVAVFFFYRTPVDWKSVIDSVQIGVKTAFESLTIPTEDQDEMSIEVRSQR